MPFICRSCGESTVATRGQHAVGVAGGAFWHEGSPFVYLCVKELRISSVVDR